MITIFEKMNLTKDELSIIESMIMLKKYSINIDNDKINGLKVLFENNHNVKFKNDKIEYNYNWLYTFLNSFKNKYLAYIDQNGNNVLHPIINVMEIKDFNPLYASTIAFYIVDLQGLYFINQSELKDYATKLADKTKTLEIFHALDLENLGYEQYVFTKNEKISDIESKIFVNVGDGISLYKKIKEYLKGVKEYE